MPYRFAFLRRALTLVVHASASQQQLPRSRCNWMTSLASLWWETSGLSIITTT